MPTLLIHTCLHFNNRSTAQDPANDPNLFFDPATKATVTLGSQPNTLPFGTNGATPVNNGNTGNNNNGGNNGGNSNTGNNQDPNAGGNNNGNNADCPVSWLPSYPPEFHTYLRHSPM
jgi:hypothetical protein